MTHPARYRGLPAPRSPPRGLRRARAKRTRHQWRRRRLRSCARRGGKAAALGKLESSFVGSPPSSCGFPPMEPPPRRHRRLKDAATVEMRGIEWARVSCPVNALDFNTASDPSQRATRAGDLAPRRRKQPRKPAKDDMQTVLILAGCKIPGFVNRD